MPGTVSEVKKNIEMVAEKNVNQRNIYIKCGFIGSRVMSGNFCEENYHVRINAGQKDRNVCVKGGYYWLDLVICWER